MSDAARRMDSIYRIQRHFYDVTREPYLPGRDTLIDGLDLRRGGAVLEIGCGTGRNLVRIARRHPGADCYGVDVSRAMLETAARSVARARLASRIRLAAGDATCFDAAETFQKERFDAVVISYSLSMIPAWRSVLEGAARLVAEGGSLNVVDFGDQHGLPDILSRALHAWLARFSVAPRHDLRACCAETARRHGARCEFTHLYRGYAGLARITF
jgi:S-adenosylmethionine-diacylgycerolhomoserine-N-methlytransferase